MKKCEACGKETEHLNRLRYATNGYQGIGQKLKSEICKDIYFKDYMFCDECKRKTDSGEKSNIDLVREAEQKRGNKKWHILK